MTRGDIADLLEEIGVLMDLKGENPFKIRAYQSGARLLSSMSEEEYREHLRLDDWDQVRGIGEALSAKIRTLHDTGRLEFHEKLKASVPPGLIDMLQIPGLGPKKIKALHEKLGITTIAELQAACQEGRVANLDGFGAKTEAKLLTGIERREAYAKRHIWWSAAGVATPIVQGLRTLAGVSRAEAAGSLRRGLETVGDLDFIVAAKDPGPVMDWFCAQFGVLEVTGRGDTKCSVRFESGLQADLRIVPEAQFAFALHHFTGSKDHNIQMRQRAIARGWSLSEWGLSAIEGRESQPLPEVSDEAGLFRALGLQEVPPELREGLGELEAAEAGHLPRLVEFSDLRGAFHNHTTESDGRNTLEEMVVAARALGWEYLGLADHSRSSVQANGLSEERLLAQVARVRSWNSITSTGLHLFAGSECDILADGSLDYEDFVLAQLDYVVASVHSGFTQDEESMTRRIVRALENPHVTMLGHLTGRLLLRRDGYRVDVARVIDAALANNVVIELNANPLRLDMDWRHWRRAAERGLLTSINPDAHTVENLEYVKAGINAARKGWLSREQVVNTLSLAELRQRLVDRKFRRP
jgi:DNA polymerase (family 10)